MIDPWCQYLLYVAQQEAAQAPLREQTLEAMPKAPEPPSADPYRTAAPATPGRTRTPPPPMPVPGCGRTVLR